MLSLRALSVALSSVVVYNCVTLLTNHAISPVKAAPEPQISLGCLLSTICCDEVTPVRLARITFDYTTDSYVFTVQTECLPARFIHRERWYEFARPYNSGGGRLFASGEAPPIRLVLAAISSTRRCIGSRKVYCNHGNTSLLLNNHPGELNDRIE